jgi:hypothetical protein
MSSITVYYENPEIIKVKPPKSILCNNIKLTNNTMCIEYKTKEMSMTVRYNGTYPEIDLSVWAKHLSLVTKLYLYSNRLDGVHNVIGFENYPNLRKIDIENDIENDIDYYADATKNLNGIEFCQHLESLKISNNNISDLTPISNLNLIELWIINNPITTLIPVNFKSLKHLKIDIRQLELINDDCDLTNLNRLCIIGLPDIISEHPKVIEIMQKYPHLKYKRQHYHTFELMIPPDE